ncbi:sensor histidine kinase [Actinoplanes sp. HUAS TT8]|uniref:sensor histidine kinase n=1 Tax=Actinoplanes sp. HUAS TT8 TaxID=3447453 RepID=UPI003F52075C
MVTWLLPAVVALTQLVVWPGLPLLLGEPIPVTWSTAVTIATVGVTAGLGLRRRRPVLSLMVVSASLAVATLVVPADDQAPMLLPIGVADLIALFSVAARCPPRTMLIALGGLVVGQGALSAVQDGVGPGVLLEMLLSVVLDGVVAALGRVRGRWTEERAAAARRLAAAEQAQREAADTERHRLARELHDVTAHHLTSIVVNAQAADLLAAQRPELRTEALSFAARTGRDTLDALRRLVAVLPAQGEEDEAPPLAELTAGFRELGQRVTLELPDGEPPRVLAGAVHGIVREALTNTLRYAPEATIKIRFAYEGEAAELVVADDGGTSETPGAPGLGGGRGVSGMRDRAQALGGTLTAGPRDGGGWRVRALLPYAGNRPRRNRWLRSQRVIDAGLALFVLGTPLGGLLAPGDGPALGPAGVVLVTSVLVAHVVPLLWRRNRPWWVLLAVVVTTWLGPLLVGVGAVRADDSWVFLFSFGAEVLAVYAVGAWGVRPERTWLAPIGATLSSAAALAVLITALIVTDQDQELTAPYAMVSVIVLTVLAGVVMAGPIVGGWAAGRAARGRRDRRREREEAGVASAAALAALRARAERARIADGLRAAVLVPAEALPRSAEEGDLGGVLSSARDALAAMRSLLDGLNGTVPDQEVASS